MDVVGIDVRQNAMIDDRGIPHVVFCGVDDVVSIENGWMLKVATLWIIQIM